MKEEKDFDVAARLTIGLRGLRKGANRAGLD
jgi:hypothetical protein